MNFKNIFFSLGVASTLIASLILLKNTQQKPIHIKWFVAHGPQVVVEEAAKKFQAELNRTAPGKFIVEFDMLEGDQIQNQEVHLREQMGKLKKGELQIAQIYTVALGKLNPQFQILDLPYLFENNEHAFKFMDSGLGQDLLATLDKHELKGLAFTYSGGPRVIVTKNKKIQSLKDFQGLKIARNGQLSNEVFKETYLRIKAEDVVLKKGDILDALENDEVDGFETVYPRILNNRENKKIGVINETYHSTHMTVVMMNKDFFEQLPNDLKPLVEAAAKKAAQAERVVAINRGELAKQQFIKEGIKVITWNEQRRAEMSKTMEGIENKFPELFDVAFVHKIKMLSKSSQLANK